MGSFSSWNQPYVCNIHKSLYSGIRIRTPRTRIMVQQPFVKDVQHELHHVSLVPSPFQHKTRKTYNSNLVEVGKCDNNFYTSYSKELHSNLRRDLYAGLQLYTCYKRLLSWDCKSGIGNIPMDSISSVEYSDFRRDCSCIWASTIFVLRWKGKA